MAKENVYLASKPRYEILDGLRGVAALLVIAYHLLENYSAGPASQIINHGYLAVDFFFILSGFVIGYAYDDRWNKMTTWGFFKRRLTRLHPMLVMGTLIGAALFYFQDASLFPNILTTGPGKFFLCLLMGLLMIPVGPSLDIRGWGDWCPFNAPTWSLTLEYCGNILYAFFFRHLSKAALAVLCLVCACFTLDLTLGWDLFGVLPDGPQYNVIGGWSLTKQHLYIGFTRLLYPFLCGLLLSKLLAARQTDENPSGSPIRVKGGFWWCSAALVVLMAVPCIGGKQGVPDGLYQAVCILLVFPLIVIAGAGSKTKSALSSRICKFLGDISYPLYITHYPFIFLQISWIERHPDAPVFAHVGLALGIAFIAILMAWALLKAYDEPVREWLKENWLKRKAR